jgi:hypothetical protein
MLCGGSNRSCEMSSSQILGASSGKAMFLCAELFTAPSPELGNLPWKRPRGEDAIEKAHFNGIGEIRTEKVIGTLKNVSSGKG